MQLKTSPGQRVSGVYITAYLGRSLIGATTSRFRISPGRSRVQTVPPCRIKLSGGCAALLVAYVVPVCRRPPF